MREYKSTKSKKIIDCPVQKKKKKSGHSGMEEPEKNRLIFQFLFPNIFNHKMCISNKIV